MTRARLPWALLFASSILSAAGLVLLLMSLSPNVPPPSWGFRGFTLIFAIAFSGVGFVVARNRPDNAIGWLFSVAGSLSAAQFLTEQYADYAYYANRSAPAGHLAAWITGWIWIPIVGIIGVYFLLLFPDGHPLSTRWRPIVWLAPVTIVLASAVIAVSPGKLPNIGVPNPFGSPRLPPLEKSLNVALQPFLVLVLLSAVSIAIRARRSRGVEREQLKWIAFAAVVLAVALAVTPTASRGRAVVWQSIIVIFAMAALPVSAGIAILRYRLYDIDRIISRTVTYAIVTGLLVGAYIGLVVLFGEATRPITGRSDLAVAASTLIVAATFIPLRRRVQNVVDRRFNRHRYDAACTIETFTARLRDEIDIDTMADELRNIVGRTMQPAYVSLWLKRES